METMKAIVIYEAGGPEKLLLEERPIPELQEGWTLVKVRGFGINHSEIFTREGLSPSVTFPRILGIECVGQVAETTREDLDDKDIVSEDIMTFHPNTNEKTIFVSTTDLFKFLHDLGYSYQVLEL